MAGQSRTGAIQALGWSFANTAISKVGTLAIGVVLARVLGPEAFGTFAVAMVALLAVLSVNELGVSLAIVRWRDDPRAIAPTVATLSIAGSMLFFVAGVIAAPAFSAAMGSPEATPVVRWLLVAVLINGLVAVPAAALQREFQQRTRTVIDQVNTWLGAIVSVVLALLGCGAMSLAIGRLAGAGVSAIMFVVSSPVPFRLGWDRALAARLARFGLPLAGASIVVFLIGYVDQIVTGAVLGSVALGMYVLAGNLASWPVTMFSQPLRAVAPAAFARMQDDPRALGRSFGAVLRALVAVSVPVCFLIAGAAEPIVRLVYGQEWLPAAAALQWLALFAAVRIVFELSYDFLVVVHRTAWILGVQLVWLVVAAGAVWAGTRAGIGGIALGQLLAGTVVVLPLYLMGVVRAGVRLREPLLRTVGPLSVGTAIFGVTAVIADHVDRPLVACLLCGAVGLAGLAVAGALDHRSFAELLGAWRARDVVAQAEMPTEVL
jgi:PST family polysaccharide transporter